MEMKKLWTVLALYFVIVSGVYAKDTKNETKVCFAVTMSCHSCQQKIEKNMAYEKGVKDLEVSLDNETVIITYRPDKTDEEQLKAALQKLGYKVVKIETQPIKEKK